MIQARFEAGVMKESQVKWRVSPYGCRVLGCSPDLVEDCSVVYMGDVTLNKGAELFVPMMNELRKTIPTAKMIVVGGGGDLPLLREKVSGSGLEDAFLLHGFVESFEEVLRIIQRGAIAVAPYNPHDENNFTFYSDPGKIKSYLGCGVPVVLTDVPPVAKVLQQRGAGVIAEYSAEDFAQKISSVLQGEREPLSLMRSNALQMGRECSWDVIFTDALSDLFIKSPA